MAKTEDFTSAYNEGMLQIQRLHQLWVQANSYSRQGLYTKWRWTLDTIWRELSRDAINSEPLKEGESFDKIEEIYWFKEYKKLNERIDDALVKKQLHGVYTSLSTLEIFLRSLQDEVGKGGKYKDPDEDGMD